MTEPPTHGTASVSERPIIEIRDLTRRFGAITAVDHLNLSIPAGEIFGLVGPDGAGKTTTLRMLCGLMEPSEGSARVAGHDVARESRAVKDQIGYMAQRFGLYGDLTVQENMDFYADLFGIIGAERQRLTVELLAMTRMEEFRGRQAGRLSGGMKQKLALMCTLLHRPRILFLDEPTNGVDPVSRRQFWAILYGLLKDGITIFMTTAYLDEAERCNRVGLMHRGKLIRCAPPEEIKRETGSATLEAAFISRIREAEGTWGGPPGPQPAPRPAVRQLRESGLESEERDEGVPRGPGGPPHGVKDA